MNVFDLVASLTLDNSDYEKKLKESENQGQSAENKLSNLGKNIGNAVVKVGKLATAGIGLATGSLVAFANKSAEATDRVDKMSQKIGVSREAFQELDFIFSQSGASVDGLQMGMKTLTNVIKKTADGTSKTKTALEELGVAVTDSEGNLRSQEDVMWDTFKALQNVEDQTTKASLATKLFGRSGTELMPMLNGAKGSIEEMQKQAHDLGLVLSDETVDAGVKFSDSFDQMKRAVAAITTELGAKGIPIILSLFDKIKEGIPTVKETVENIISKGTEVVDFLGETFSPTFEALKELFGAVTESIQPFLDNLSDLVTDEQTADETTNALKNTIQKLADGLTTAIEKITDFVKWLNSGKASAEAFKAIVVGLASALLAYKTLTVVVAGLSTAMGILNAVMAANPIGIVILAITALIGALIYLWNTNEDFRKAVIKIFNAIKSKVVEVFEAWKHIFTEVVPEILEKLREKVKEKIDQVLAIIMTIALLKEKALTWGKDLIDNFVQGIKDKINKVKDTVKDVANTVKDFLGFSEPKKGPLSNFHTYAPDMIDLFVKGLKDNEWKIDKQLENSFNIQPSMANNDNGIDYRELATTLAYALSNVKVEVDSREFGRLTRKAVTT